MEAAARVFDREGIDATTNRIAEEAGVSVGSLYQYFSDKHALLHELAMRHLDEAQEAFDASWPNHQRVCGHWRSVWSKPRWPCTPTEDGCIV